ncbi:MAG TPA: hypothetical protein VJ553_02650 [Candidatus Paceibacterota bacterium]|nr:hypothetical protein [Candidatus Paceibacterota bacterium]
MDTITKHSIRNALLTALYIVAVVSFMQNAERLFGNQPEALAAIAMILLFVTSALITGSLVLWEPARLLFDGKPREATRQILTTGSALVVLFVVVLGVLLFT